jgi:hypothetical protein
VTLSGLTLGFIKGWLFCLTLLAVVPFMLVLLMVTERMMTTGTVKAK